MNKELAFKFVKYIAEMMSNLERKSSVTIEDVAQLNRELEGFKIKVRNENGFRSEVYANLSVIRLELDARHLDGSLLNAVLSIKKATTLFGLMGLFEEKSLNEDVLQGLGAFKNQLQSFAYRFDDFDWREEGEHTVGID